MPRLNASATLLALPDVNVETPNDGLTGNLHLVLLIDVILLHMPTTFVALLWQRNVNDFVGFLLGRRAVGFRPVLLAAFAAGLLGVLLRGAFRKRGGLSLASPSRLVHKLFELGHTRLKLHDLRFELAIPRFELSDPAILLGDDVKQLLVGRLGHPGRSRPAWPAGRCPLPPGLTFGNSDPIGKQPGATPANPDENKRIRMKKRLRIATGGG